MQMGGRRETRNDRGGCRVCWLRKKKKKEKKEKKKEKEEKKKNTNLQIGIVLL